jgi:hypothetical protein
VRRQTGDSGAWIQRREDLIGPGIIVEIALTLPAAPVPSLAVEYIHMATED